MICGPVFVKGREIEWIGDAGEKRIPVPHGFFKIVIRERKGKLDVLAFVFPHKEIKKIGGKYDYSAFLTSVDFIEKLTGLDFLTALPDEEGEMIERRRAERIWSR